MGKNKDNNAKSNSADNFYEEDLLPESTRFEYFMTYISQLQFVLMVCIQHCSQNLSCRGTTMECEHKLTSELIELINKVAVSLNFLTKAKPDMIEFEKKETYKTSELVKFFFVLLQRAFHYVGLEDVLPQHIRWQITALTKNRVCDLLKLTDTRSKESVHSSQIREAPEILHKIVNSIHTNHNQSLETDKDNSQYALNVEEASENTESESSKSLDHMVLLLRIKQLTQELERSENARTKLSIELELMQNMNTDVLLRNDHLTFMEPRNSDKELIKTLEEQVRKASLVKRDELAVLENTIKQLKVQIEEFQSQNEELQTQIEKLQSHNDELQYKTQEQDQKIQKHEQVRDRFTDIMKKFEKQKSISERNLSNEIAYLKRELTISQAMQVRLKEVLDSSSQNPPIEDNNSALKECLYQKYGLDNLQESFKLSESWLNNNWSHQQIQLEAKQEIASLEDFLQHALSVVEHNMDVLKNPNPQKCLLKYLDIPDLSDLLKLTLEHCKRNGSGQNVHNGNSQAPCYPPQVSNLQPVAGTQQPLVMNQFQQPAQTFPQMPLVVPPHLLPYLNSLMAGRPHHPSPNRQGPNLIVPPGSMTNRNPPNSRGYLCPSGPPATVQAPTVFNNPPQDETNSRIPPATGNRTPSLFEIFPPINDNRVIFTLPSPGQPRSNN